MEIAGLGIAMIAISVLLLVWAFGSAQPGLWQVAYGTSVFEDLDTVDARFVVRGEQSPPADLAVVKPRGCRA